MSGPLDGIRVLDISHYLAGPYATMLLADMGAEVIKIERPDTGDEARAFGSGSVTVGELTDYYLSVNRSKRSIAVDLHNPEGVEIVRQLASRSDIVIENYRTGVLDGLGLGYEDLRIVRRGLVYTSISGFGPSGPWSKLPANDVMMQSMSGVMAATGEPDGPPLRCTASICDISAGLFALAGTLAALGSRDRHPEGQHVEVAMFDSAIALIGNFVPSASAGFHQPKKVGRRHPQILGQSSHLCADGKYVTIGAFSESFWKRLLSAIARDEWIDDPRFATNALRVENREELDAGLDDAFLSHTRDEWVDILRQADVPCSPVLELREALATEQARHNDIVVQLGDGDTRYGVVRSPVRSAQWGETNYAPVESVGQSTREVLMDILNHPENLVDSLISRSAVGSSAESAPKAKR